MASCSWRIRKKTTHTWSVSGSRGASYGLGIARHYRMTRMHRERYTAALRLDKGVKALNSTSFRSQSNFSRCSEAYWVRVSVVGLKEGSIGAESGVVTHKPAERAGQRGHVEAGEEEQEHAEHHRHADGHHNLGPQ